MSIAGKNYIAGLWQAGESEVENRNPSDLSDLIGVYAQASSAQLQQTLEQAKVAQKEWAAYGLERISSWSVFYLLRCRVFETDRRKCRQCSRWC